MINMDVIESFVLYAVIIYSLWLVYLFTKESGSMIQDDIKSNYEKYRREFLKDE